MFTDIVLMNSLPKFTFFLKFFQCGDRIYTSESDVYRRQIMISKDGPCAKRVIHYLSKF